MQCRHHHHSSLTVTHYIILWSFTIQYKCR